MGKRSRKEVSDSDISSDESPDDYKRRSKSDRKKKDKKKSSKHHSKKSRRERSRSFRRPKGRSRDRRKGDEGGFRFDSPPKDHELTKGAMAAASSIGGGGIANA